MEPLSDTDKRIVIALATEKISDMWVNIITRGKEFLSQEAYERQVRIFLLNMPDYFNDLNAMAKVEKSLGSRTAALYYEKLTQMCQNKESKAISADAATRANAFFETIRPTL